MIGVVLATKDDLVASVVAAESWRATTGSDAVVLVDHPDLVRPFSRAHGGAEVLSWAELDASPDEPGGLLAAVLGRHPPGTTCVVLPATAFVLGAPAALADAAEEGIAIASRARRPPEPTDRLRPTDEDVAQLGRLHTGLLALRSADERAAAFLRWLDATPAALRPVLLQTQADRVVEVDDPGLGVGWWNLHERPLSWEGGRLLAAGRPVVVVDLDGWDPRHEHLLHPDMTRLLGSGDPALRRLVEGYARRSAEVADRLDGIEARTWPEDPALEDLLGQRPEDRDDLLRDAPGARDAFLAWAGETDPEDTVWGLNRYLVALRRTRYDLQAAFPDVNDRGDVAAYLAWARGDGAALGVPARFLGPVPLVDAVRHDGPPEDTGDGLGGVNVIGLFDEPALGIAEIARQVLAGLESSGLPVHRVTVDRRGRPDPSEGDLPLPFRVTVACLNGDLLPVVRERLRRRVRDDSHHVGVWWWELSEVPSDWDPAIALVHEIWAGTRFVADAFSTVFDGPVATVPLGLGSLPEAGAPPPAVAGDDRPYVLVTFDYASRIERKNPVGAIQAFLRAELGPDVRLVVKSVNGDRWPREAERVRLAALEAPDAAVVLLDERLGAAEQAALVAGAAAHLALHRSEGLGLTIVEAMLRGVPVVATDFGGSTDLLDATTGWPVAWTPGRVPTGCEPYPAGASWAEPDLEDAAQALRDVLGGGDAVTERVRAGRASAEERARRIATGEDLGSAARAAITALREAEEARRAELAAQRGIRGRIGRLRG